MLWKNFGEMSTDDGHKVYFSGEEDRHEYGVGFLVHKDVVDAVLGCRPVSSRLISIHVRAAPFNITIIQVMHQHLVYTIHSNKCVVELSSKSVDELSSIVSMNCL